MIASVVFRFPVVFFFRQVVAVRLRVVYLATPHISCHSRAALRFSVLLMMHCINQNESNKIEVQKLVNNYCFLIF